ncbi:EscU/YscU/HrcU family type III secretion system export apparatus switch protein [Arhodomonas aquaeolei]|uniref:EscU/YscU/HrcU family type III secretion system export apparatus switch protein n=1 Tax=Arhodomonas aquaeolei TaxID=2369 RepID=UPI00035FFC29|nr:EscU/YscU/HrcU family type III secretion system export apparatus switch protein [Arhodomonas aquaeolei]
MTGPDERRRIAVALEYSGDSAPRVTASGQGVTADEIRRIAEAHGVPLDANADLAEVLATLPLGQEIPEDLYRAVAEVIAFAYWVRGRVPTGYSAREKGGSER